MDLLSELTIAELTALLSAIIVTLIPLIIWAFYHIESRRRDSWIRRGQKRIRAKVH